uniref:Ig-like domain-containing protein n=1 Tax=Denticeps clupeoides TaxID=299321 RepID=A0AAY4CMM4_9TELE
INTENHNILNYSHTFSIYYIVSPNSLTPQDYSILEKETVSFQCQAPSSPPSQYIWFYNNSQVYTGQQLTISSVLRDHTGHYTCLAQNLYLKTNSKNDITLTIYLLNSLGFFILFCGANVTLNLSSCLCSVKQLVC